MASTWRKVSTPPVRPPFVKERLTPCGAPRKLCKENYTNRFEQKRIFSEINNRFKRDCTCVILPNNVADDDRRRCGAIPAAPLAFNVRWSSNRRVEALDNQ